MYGGQQGQGSGHLSLRVWLTLAVILIAGAGLRFYHLGTESLWSDELQSWRQSSYSSLGEVIDQGVRPDTHPPAFQVVLFAVERTLGSSEWTLRLPSAIFGILSILVVFWIGWRWMSAGEGLMAAFLMAVLWCPIYFSQEARDYSLVLLAALLSSACWAELASSVRRESKVGTWPAIGYVLSALLACYSHYYGMLLVALQAVGLLILSAIRPRSLRGVVSVYGAVVLGYLPWIPSMMAQTSHAGLVSWMEPPGMSALPAFISFVFNRWDALAILVMLLYAYLLYWTIRHRRTSAAKWCDLLMSSEATLGYWLVLPLIFMWTYSVVVVPLYTQRNLIVSLPAAYLLLSRAISKLPIRGWMQAGLALLLGGSALYQMIFVTGYYRYSSKEQFREAVQYVIDRYDPDRTSVIVGFSKYAYYFDYYFERLGSPLRIDWMAGETEDIGTFDDYIRDRNPERIWYIAGHASPKADFLSHLTSTLELADSRTFLGAQVWLFRRVPTAP